MGEILTPDEWSQWFGVLRGDGPYDLDMIEQKLRAHDRALRRKQNKALTTLRRARYYIVTNSTVAWDADGATLGGGSATPYNHQAGRSGIPADARPSACWLEPAALSAPKEGPGLSLFKRPADVVLDCPECNGTGDLCLPEWEGMNRPCDYCGGTGSAPKEYNPDMDVDPMHTEDHYNGDELPGMWEKADLIGGETDNIKEDNTCE